MLVDEKELMTTIANALGCNEDTLKMDSGYKNHYSWDSFGHLSVIVALEEKYDIEIKEDSINKLQNCRQILEYLSKEVKPDTV